mgnify:CR=1 FL=1
MTFKQFLVNYLSPWYLTLRLFWFCDAFLGFFFTTGILVGQGWSQRSALFVGYAVAAVFLWIALRPWKVGASYRDIERKVDQLSNKYR